MGDMELLLGDCIEQMGKLEAKSIDCIICDLPYGTTACNWDIVIPFNELWREYNRIAKDNAPIVLFSSQPFTSLLVSSNIKNFKEELVWLKNKAGSGLQSKQKHIKIHENICIFAKTSSYTYNPQKWLVEDKELWLGDSENDFAPCLWRGAYFCIKINAPKYTPAPTIDIPLLLNR